MTIVYSPSTTTPVKIDYCHVAVICPRCNGAHTLEQCPQVESIEYYENGKVKRVTFRERNPLGPPFEVTFSYPETTGNKFNTEYKFTQGE